ncbi:MAG: agglutinin biogenesis protein MshI [Nitrosomonadales bacterium]|nr:agglutinin biogenesis protein MshI [Nitrosomonadales bacterium]
MNLPNLSDLFSRTRQRVGWFAVCLSSKGVYFSHVKHTKNKPHVMVCAFHPAENVTPALLEKLRRDARVGGFQFVTLLDPGEYQMMLVEAPKVPVDELKTAVRWRIKDMLNYHIDDATVDVLQIPASKKSGGDRPQSLYAIAAPNETIKKRIALFEKAKIDLKVIEIPETAQRNIAALFDEDERGLALLSFGDNGGLLTITCGGELYLARHLEITAGQLQDADDGLRRQALERVELELHRSLDYFGRQFSHIPVSRMLVSAPEQLGLAQQLASGLDLPVEQLDLAGALDISAVPNLADSGYAAHMLPALGASLRIERRAL